MVSPFLPWLQGLYEFFRVWCPTVSFGRAGTSLMVSPAVQEMDGIHFGLYLELSWIPVISQLLA